MPATTEEAQYSLAFPVAAALVHGTVTVEHISAEGLRDAQVIALSERANLIEEEAFNEPFPERRISRVRMTLHDGRVLDSGPTEATGDPEDPFTDAQLSEKFFSFALPNLGRERALALHDCVWALGTEDGPPLSVLQDLIYTPVRQA